MVRTLRQLFAVSYLPAHRRIGRRRAHPQPPPIPSDLAPFCAPGSTDWCPGQAAPFSLICIPYGWNGGVVVYRARLRQLQRAVAATTRRRGHPYARPLYRLCVCDNQLSEETVWQFSKVSRTYASS
jgi:hypothetical protein